MKRSGKESAPEKLFLAEVASKIARIGGWTIQLPERTLTWSDENCVIHDVPPGYQPTLEEGLSYFPEEYRAKVVHYVETCINQARATGKIAILR